MLGCRKSLSFRTGCLLCVLIVVLAISNAPWTLAPKHAAGSQLAVVGDQKIVVLLMKFRDIATEPDPPTHYAQRIFNEMNVYYVESSFGQVSVSGKIYGWYTLPQPWSYYVNSQYPSGNNLGAILEDSTKVADADVDFRNFQHAIIVVNNHLVPPPGCCVAFALGTQNIQTSKGPVRLTVLLYPVTAGDPAHAPLGVFAHELAHDLGLSHSLSGNWDVMSGCNGPLCDKPPHPISYGKIRLGWINPSQVRTINLGESAAVEIHELETKSSSYQVVKIPLSNGTYYLIESRKRVGFDSYLPGEGVLISHVDETRKEPSHLVDANPSTSTLDDAAWQVGQIFTDAANGFSITVTASSTHSYTISISPTQPMVKGKILFDETHNEYWESTIEQGYSGLAQELRNAGFVAESLTSGTITYEKISQYNVLVISSPFTPPKPLATDEVDAIKRFVSGGGGLLLGATGWSWVAYAKQSIDTDPANQIGREFGITVNDDRIYDPTHNDGDPGIPLFHKFANHPITAGLTTIWGGVPSSLKVVGSAQVIVLGDEDAYARSDTVQTYPKGSNPPFVAVAQFGNGRVVFVGNDAIFHAAPQDNLRKYDNLRFAMNVFSWLSSAQPAAPITVTTTVTILSVSTVFTIPPMDYGLVSIGIGIAVAGLAIAIALLRRRIPEGTYALTTLNVLDPVSGDAVSLAVQPQETLASIIKRAIHQFNLPSDVEFDLAFKGKKLEPAMTLRQLALRDGARLELRQKG